MPITTTDWSDEQWDDIVDLLTYVAAADRRTVGETDVRVWLDAARDGKWPSIDFAYRAVVRHRNDQPGTWLEPGHITQLLRRVQREASASFDPSTIRPPREVVDADNMDAAYLAWIKGLERDHHDQAIARFIDGVASGPRAISRAS